MSKERAARTFALLQVGDVLLNCGNDKDVAMVVRVGDRLDLLNLVDGRYLEAQIHAAANVPDDYDVLRGAEIVMGNGLGQVPFRSFAALKKRS